jgi:hypothetical protein
MEALGTKTSFGSNNFSRFIFLLTSILLREYILCSEIIPFSKLNYGFYLTSEIRRSQWRAFKPHYLKQVVGFFFKTKEVSIQKKDFSKEAELMATNAGFLLSKGSSLFGESVDRRNNFEKEEGQNGREEERNQ